MSFNGLYNVIITFRDNRGKKEYKRVTIDNKFDNFRLVNEKNEAVLIVKSDIRKFEYNSKDCN